MLNQTENQDRPQHYGNMKQLFSIATGGGSGSELLELILPYIGKVEPSIIDAIKTKTKELEGSLDFDEVAYIVKTIQLPNGSTRLGIFLTPLHHIQDEEENLVGAKLGTAIEKDSLGSFAKKMILGAPKK